MVTPEEDLEVEGMIIGLPPLPFKQLPFATRLPSKVNSILHVEKKHGIVGLQKNKVVAELPGGSFAFHNDCIVHLQAIAQSTQP
jgi:hypothetical protein